MSPKSLCGSMLWSKLSAILPVLLLTLGQAFAEGNKLAVINQRGEVWARDLYSNRVSVGVKLNGPSLFGGPDDRYVIASANSIAVVTASGEAWSRTVTDSDVSQPTHLSGSLFGGPDAKYVLDGGPCGIDVVNQRGEV